MFQHIRWRIALPYVALILMIMLAMGIYLSNLLRQTYRKNMEAQLLTKAELVGKGLNACFPSDGSYVDLDEQAKMWAETADARVTLIAPDGTVIGESHDDRLRMDNHANRPEIIQAVSQGKGSSIRYSHTEGYDMLYTAVPVYDDNTITGFVRLALPMKEIQSYLGQLQRTIAIATIIASVIATLLAMWIASRTTRPLAQLTKAANRIASGDLSSNIIPRTSDEVGQLTDAFNMMSEQLRTHINALESERGKLSAVLNEMSDGVLIVDAEGKIQLINPAAESMFGVNHQEAMDHSLIEALRQYQLVELWQKCRETGEIQATLIEIPSQRLYLQSVATSLGKALPDSTLLLFQNLTRVRHLETVRQDFMSNISHELRTPLASLKALTETLQESALDDPITAKHFLQNMETEVDSLSLMVSELLELSRIESGRVPLKMQAISPMVIINQAVERLSLQADRAGLSVDVICQSETPPILADPDRLEQVLVNLLHNAIKFTPSGGSISIRCQSAQGKVQISVQDTGIGISPDDLTRIFERFYKTDRARSSGGTGLGLAIARHLVEAHGGQIWADSVENQGSTFYLTIPIAT